MTEKPIKLTKSGKVDRRSETSKLNMSKAQLKAKEVLSAIKKKNIDEFVSDSEYSSSDDEDEADDELEEKEIPIPKKRTKEMIKDLDEKIEKLFIKKEEPVKEPIKEETIFTKHKRPMAFLKF